MFKQGYKSEFKPKNKKQHFAQRSSGKGFFARLFAQKKQGSNDMVITILNTTSVPNNPTDDGDISRLQVRFK